MNIPHALFQNNKTAATASKNFILCKWYPSSLWRPRNTPKDVLFTPDAGSNSPASWQWFSLSSIPHTVFHSGFLSELFSPIPTGEDISLPSKSEGCKAFLRPFHLSPSLLTRVPLLGQPSLLRTFPLLTLKVPHLPFFPTSQALTTTFAPVSLAF